MTDFNAEITKKLREFGNKIERLEKVEKATLLGNIIMPDGGTVGQAAGPLLTFNDTNNILGITGCNVGIGTTNPTSTLDIRSSSTSIVRIQNTLVTGYSTVDLYNSSGVQKVGLGWGNASSGLPNLGYLGTSQADSFSLLTDSTPRLTILPTTGNVGIGTTAPTARMHLHAGSATASTGPLKLTAGTLLTTPEPGALEYDGTHFYGTDSGGTRKQLDN